MRRLINFEAAVQVAQIVLIRNHRVIAVAAPASAKRRPGGEIQGPALAIFTRIFIPKSRIIVDIPQLQHRFAIPTEVAPLHFREQAATLDILRCEGGIIMGCQIQIVRQGQIGPTAGAG